MVVGQSPGSMHKPMKLAILGASGIGKVHARIFHSLGAEVSAILGSSMPSAVKTAEMLFTSFGFRPKPFENIDDLLAEPIDAVCICTPPHLHFNQMIRALDKGLPVFCEKPLFWDADLTVNSVKEKLEQLKLHPQRRLIMNAPNAFFLDVIRDRFNPEEIKTFKFSFHTNGNYKGPDIGIDLFTHGLSILYRVFGLRKTADYSFTYTDSTYCCQFLYGNSRVEFDFRADPKGAKYFALQMDDRIFTRIQEGAGATYNLYFHDSVTDEKIKVEDPFVQSIRAFIQYYNAGAPLGKDQFERSEMIMNMMSENLITKP